MKKVNLRCKVSILMCNLQNFFHILLSPEYMNLLTYKCELFNFQSLSCTLITLYSTSHTNEFNETKKSKLIKSY